MHTSQALYLVDTPANYRILATSYPNKPTVNRYSTLYGPPPGTRSTEPVSLGKTRKKKGSQVSDQMDPNGRCRKPVWVFLLIWIPEGTRGKEKKKKERKATVYTGGGRKKEKIHGSK